MNGQLLKLLKLSSSSSSTTTNNSTTNIIHINRSSTSNTSSSTSVSSSKASRCSPTHICLSQRRTHQATKHQVATSKHHQVRVHTVQAKAGLAA